MEERALVQIVIEELRLGALALFHARNAALLLEPVEHETEHINIVARGRIVHGILVDHALIAHHQRRNGALVPGERAVDDHDRQPRGGHVLLCPGIDDAEFRHVHRVREDLRGHITHDRHAAGLRHILPRRTEDRVVGAVIKILCLRRERKLLLRRDAVKAGSLARCRDVHAAVFSRFLRGDIGKVAGHGVIGRVALGGQIERDHRKLERRAALQKQDLVRVRHGERLFELRFCRGKYIHKFPAAVAHLHHGETAAVIVQQLGCRRLQHFRRQHGRPGGEIEYVLAVHGWISFPVFPGSRGYSDLVYYIPNELVCQSAVPTSISPRTPVIFTFLTTPCGMSPGTATSV